MMRRERAHSMVEAIVAMTLVLVVILFAFRTGKATTTLARTGENQLVVMAEADKVMSNLVADLSAASTTYAANYHVASDGKALGFKRIKGYTLSGNNGVDPGIVEVLYVFNGKQLIRYEGIMDPRMIGTDPATKKRVLAANVTGARFEVNANHDIVVQLNLQAGAARLNRHAATARRIVIRPRNRF